MQSTKILRLFIFFEFVFNHSVSGAIILANFQQEALNQHNYYRQQVHCTSALALNSTLNSIAQNYAQYLAANNIFNHSRAPGLGENLYYTWSSAGINSLNGSVPTTAWYNEISLYNYSTPVFSSGTGHFTQVVWSSSTQLGIGVALTSNNQTAYVVANYLPPGNYAGQFGTNVLPVCTSTTTTTTAAGGTTSGATTTSNTGTTTSGATTTTNAGTTTTGNTITLSTTTTTSSNNTAVAAIPRDVRFSVVITICGSLIRLLAN